MAGYAALVSLMNTINQIQIHPRISTYFGKEHMESLGETVGVLLDFVESYNGSKEVEDLESQIVAAAHAAEDAIESHVVDQILPKKKSTGLQKMMRWLRRKPSWQKALGDMYSIKEYVIGRLEDPRLIISLTAPPAASSRPVSAGKATMVGFDEYLIHLLDKLTGQPSHQLVILPISGMGGVGKTTLARNAFDNFLVKQHFDFRAWATISQNYSSKEILLGILSSQDKQEALNELGEKLHKFLFNRRYLIVLDDMWSTEIWDDIKFFFPENNNGSRIVVTTRLLNVALHFNSSYHTVDLLNENKSWNLFCQEAFGEKGCPAELEEVGKKICKNCRGLPLSIVVIGGFLRKPSTSREHWEGIARDTHSILNSEGDSQCLNILSLSYNHLPAHLKPCFLYMGVFAEDERIHVSRLIQFWVAAGFVRPKDDQSLEEVAEGHLKDLVDRNLVMALRSNGEIRECYIHDLIRELCLSVAEKENFFCVMKSGGTPRTFNGERHIVIDASMSNEEVSRALGSESLVHSLICEGNRSSKFRLQRLPSTGEEAPNKRTIEADLRCVNLRYLEYQYDLGFPRGPFYIPRQISLLWNLQTLRIPRSSKKNIIAPSAIWEMVQLRHIHVYNFYIPDPSRSDRVGLVLPNLHTLKYVKDFMLSEEACKRIPNIKRLSLIYEEFEWHDYCLQNLGRLRKLESVTLRFEYRYWFSKVRKMTFPTSLKKLTLHGYGYDGIFWKDLEMIGSIPKLEVFKFRKGSDLKLTSSAIHGPESVLKLRRDAIHGSMWNPVEGGFGCLKFLQIESCKNLRIWNADHFHFPVLEKLVIRDMEVLEEIPPGIGDIPTLRNIRLFDCNPSCSLSAVKILEEQESLGKDDLQLEIEFSDVWSHMRFIEMVEEEGFTSNNLHIKRDFWY